MICAAESGGRMSRVMPETVSMIHTKTGMRPRRHPGPAHRQRRRHEVDRGGDGADAGDEHREVPVVRGIARGEGLAGQRGIGEPADRRRRARAIEPLAADEAEVEQEAAEEEDPEPEGIEPRERQVAGADHQRHEVVPEPEHDGDPDEEHHAGAVHGEEPVERLRRDDVQAGPRELQPHQARLDPRDHEEEEAGADVHHAEPLVVDGGDPAVQPLERAPPRVVSGQRRRQHAHRSLTGLPCCA